MMRDRLGIHTDAALLFRLAQQQRSGPRQQVMLTGFGQDHRFADLYEALQVRPLQCAMSQHAPLFVDRDCRSQFAATILLEKLLGGEDLGMKILRAVDAGGEFGNTACVIRRQQPNYGLLGFYAHDDLPRVPVSIKSGSYTFRLGG